MTEIWAGICRLIRIQAYDVQIWCCKKVIEITEAWE